MEWVRFNLLFLGDFVQIFEQRNDVLVKRDDCKNKIKQNLKLLEMIYLFIYTVPSKREVAVQ